MSASAFLLGALAALLPAQDPEVSPAASGAAQEPYSLETDSIDSWQEEGAMVYQVDHLRLFGPDLNLRADRALIWFDAEEYGKLVGQMTEGEEAPAGPSAQAGEGVGEPNILSGLWSRRILTALGLPQDSELLLEIRLDGHVLVEMQGLVLQCDRLQDWPRDGRGKATAAVLDFPPQTGGPNGWPMRIAAAEMEERPDGSLFATDVRVSTCLERPPHYSIAFGELTAERVADGEFVWRPAQGWLQLFDIPFLPVPTPDFTPGDNFMGFRGIVYKSSRSMGNTIAPRFGGMHKPADSSLELDWNLEAAYSARRGYPLHFRLDAGAENYRGSFDLFFLNDEAQDKHSLKASLGRASDARTRLRWYNRWQLPDSWQLDANLVHSSDPMIDPEFFRREWEEMDDAETRLYLRRPGQNEYLSLDTRYRLDDVGFTPLEGLGRAPSPAAQSLDVMPRVRYDAFSTSRMDLPTGPLGGTTGSSPVNVDYGAEFGILQLRDRDLVAARSGEFASSPTRTRTRGRAWAGLAVPMRTGAFYLRPGVDLQGSLWQDSTSGAEQEEQLHSEFYFESGIVLEKRFEQGWRHKILPQLRLRRRVANRLPDTPITEFDRFDRIVDGEVAELSLRQFFYAPGSSSPWLDVNLLVPWFTDGTRLLDSEIAPFPRSQPSAGVGPTEMRVVWTPGTFGKALSGVRWDARLRHDFEIAETEEIFTRLMIRPNPSLYYGASYFEVNRTSTDAAIGAVFGGLRFTEQLAVGFQQSVNFDGAAGVRSGVAAQYYGHDFLFEIGYTEVQYTGETGFYFNLSPRFFVDAYGKQNLARLRFN